MAYVPTSMTTATPGLQGLDRIFYVRKALDRLQKKFLFRKPCDPEDLPLHSGRTATWYRYNNLTADTTTATEGTVGTGGTINAQTLTATVSQFVNFISLSDFQVETYYEGLVAAASELLGYRAGLTVDTLSRLVFDNEQASVSQTAVATYLKAIDLRQIRHSFQGQDVQPFENGKFLAISHPYCTYDLVNDPNVLGYGDLTKYTDKSGGSLNSAPDRGLFVETAHCDVWESTNVKVSSSNYSTYVFGKGAAGCLNLAGKGPSNVVDPRNERFKIIVTNGSPGPWDPAGQIGATVAYNFKTVTFVKEGPAPIGGTYRYKILATPTTLV